MFVLAVHEGLQAIQLEDGTTAYITHPNPEALFGEGAAALDAATLESLSAQVQVNTPFKPLLFLQLFDLGTLPLAMHKAVEALQRLLPGSAVDLWFTRTIAEPGLNGESQSVGSRA